MSIALSMNSVKDSSAVQPVCRSASSLNSDPGVKKFCEGAGDGLYEIAKELCVLPTVEVEETCMAPVKVYSGAGDDGKVSS
ncbi:hypothetical protein CGMCC3_g17783 [Colletotrichum fructicola]|nr:uncharacterized protein CGMCC3_g17783 [Colletotrichum fructicola]KAE9566041.1 hypothetical protein CGMCC3_g17783 [Colletotrichum fructicola]